MKELCPSNESLRDPRALREALDAEGYVFFRDVLDHDLITHVRHGVMAWFEGQHLIEVVDDEPLYTGADVGAIGDYPAGLCETRLWEWFALTAEVRRFYELVFGERGIVLPIGQYQFTWPTKEGCWSRIHQDGPFSTGLDFLVFWFPLMVIPEEMGGLAIVPTPQRVGSLHPDLEKNPTSPFIPLETFAEDAWHRADYRPGDALVFAPFTPHCGMPNYSDRMRLSIDFRVQPVSAPRPIIGVVVATDPDGMVIASDSGEEIALSVDERTAMRLPVWVEGRLGTSAFLGLRVIATEEAGRALLVRNPFGHVPWEQ
jgi:hypothetical protein